MRCSQEEGPYHLTLTDRAYSPAPDLVKRNFTPGVPVRLWVADITYVRTWEGWLYLAFVLDTYSRKVVGWSMANNLTAGCADVDPGMSCMHNRLNRLFGGTVGMHYAIRVNHTEIRCEVRSTPGFSATVTPAMRPRVFMTRSVRNE